jgi:hypothetical protein
MRALIFISQLFSSQRISVGTFREAQARRSTAGSPVPSLPGDRDSFVSARVQNRKLSSALGTLAAISIAGAQPHPQRAARRRAAQLHPSPFLPA